MSGNERVSAGARRILLWVTPVLILGLGFSIELTRIYYRSMKDVEFDALCRFSDRLDCISVALSPYSLIIGIPNSVFGIAFYIAAVLLVALQLKATRPVFKNARNYLFLLSLVGFIYSLYLGAISSFVLRNFCLYCTVLYVLNFILFLLAFFAIDPPREFFQQFTEDGRALMKDNLAFGLLVGCALILIIAGVFQSWRVEVQKEKRLAASMEDKEYELDLEGDPVLGSESALVTIVEFTDYECYHCARMHSVLKQLELKYRPRVRIIFKTFPIHIDCNPYLRVMAHPHACEAAYATECACRYGVFEEYTDRLFAARELAWDELLSMAEELGLDRDEFETCMKSDPVWEAVRKDAYDAHILNLRGTPVIFVNGRKFEGYRSLKDMSLIVDSFLHGFKPKQ
jgi:protein-disulfide isomerase